MSGGWSQETRDRTFYTALVASAAAVVWLVWPFLEVVAFAAVVAVVSSPIHQMLTRRLGGRRLVAALVMVGLLVLFVVVPAGALLYRAMQEAVSMAGTWLSWINSSDFDAWLADARGEVRRSSWVPRSWLPAGADPLDTLIEPLRNSATTLLANASSLLPTVINRVAFGVLDTLLLVFTSIIFLADGPKIASFVEPLVPLDARYQRRLFEVFRRFALALVMGTGITAVVQGAVASIGYAFVGLPNPLAWGVATALGGFVPIIGTSVVVVPACLTVAKTAGIGWGIGLMLYALAVVGTVDNVIKPLIMSGQSNVHPLLIFLSVFGGLWWMGLTGVFIGPVLVSFFLALATIHAEDFGAIPPPTPVVGEDQTVTKVSVDVSRGA